MERFSAAARAAHTALFPERCLSCLRIRGAGGAAGLCLGCRGLLRPPPANICAACALPLDFTFDIDTGTEYFCGKCRLDPPPFDAAMYAIAYEGPIREVIHAFKFGQSPHLAGPLADMGMERLAPWLAQRRGAVIIPVPLHWRRLHWRGYNHAYLLASRLGRMAGLAVDEGLLRRARHTKQQYGLNREERGKNVKEAFSTPAPEKLAGRDVVLFDDIITTGATARECCKTLQKCKPNSVAVATLCKAGA